MSDLPVNQRREYEKAQLRLAAQPKCRQQFQPIFESELECGVLDEPWQILKVSNHPFLAQDISETVHQENLSNVKD